MGVDGMPTYQTNDFFLKILNPNNNIDEKFKGIFYRDYFLIKQYEEKDLTHLRLAKTKYYFSYDFLAIFLKEPEAYKTGIHNIYKNTDAKIE